MEPPPSRHNRCWKDNEKPKKKSSFHNGENEREV